MANMLDYIDWRGDLIFSKSRINKIDLLIMSQIVMLDLENIVSSKEESYTITVEEAAKKYFDPNSRKKMEIGLIIPKTIFDLFQKIASSKRFRKIKLTNYVNVIDEKKEEQMSALEYIIDDDNICVAFSGTDDTIIGWKENLNMIYKSPIPAQISALKYIEEVTKDFNGNVFICGHSKGGNLALYTSAFASHSLQEKIAKVYNFDGPGFSEVDNKIDNITHFGKVKTIIPQGSIIGRLFQHKEKCLIVKSIQNGLYQHDAFSWEILGKDFIEEKEITKDSDNVDKKIKSIIESMTEEKKIKFCDNIYRILNVGEIKNLLDLSKQKKLIWEEFWKLSKEDKKCITDPIRELLKDKYFRKIIFSSLRSYKSYNT